MKVTTDSAIEPQIVLDTTSHNFEMGEDAAQDNWVSHCEGETSDECALHLTESVMERFVQLDRQDAAEYTFGLMRGLLRRTRKPVGAPAHLEGGAQ